MAIENLDKNPCISLFHPLALESHNYNVVINTECEGVCYRIYAQQKLRRESIIKEEHEVFITIIKSDLSGFKKHAFIFMR